MSEERTAQVIHERAVKALRALEEPVDERQVSDFVRAARLSQVQPDASWVLWTWLLSRQALVLGAAAALLLALSFGVRQQSAQRVSVGPLYLLSASGLKVQPPVDEGQALAEASVLVSDEVGRAVLQDPATAKVSLSARTRVKVARWRSKEAVLEVEQGELRAEVVHRAPDQRFEVRTPYAVVRVVGTVFVVNHEPGQVTLVQGIEGRVRVETLDGRLLGLVGAGESLRVEPPRVVSAPQKVPLREVPLREVPLREVPLRDVPPREVPPREVPLRAPASGREASPQDAPIPVGEAARLRPVPHVEVPRAPAEAPRLEVPPAVTLATLRAQLAGGQEAQVVEALERLPSRTWAEEALLGEALWVSGRLGRARAAYERAMDIAGEPPPERLLWELADLLVRQGDKDEARLWRRYLEVYPHGRVAPRALWRLASLDPAQEEALLSRLLREYSDRDESRGALLRLGRRLLARKDYAGAEALFADAQTSRDPLRAEAALVGLAHVRLGQGRPAEARALLESWDERFPQGARRDEVNRLKAALP